MIKPNVYKIVGVAPTSRLPSYTSIGCYPIVYLTRRGDVMCANCATLDDNDDNPVSDAGVHWEGPDHTCDECGDNLPSAYGDPECSDVA
jgi:hypothetical protein